MADLPGGGAAHEVVAAVLAVTPTWNGQVITDYGDPCECYSAHCSRIRDVFGDPAPIAARQAAAALRRLAEWAVSNEWRTSPLMLADNLANLADEIDPREVARG